MRRTRSRPADSTMLDASSGCLKRMRPLSTTITPGLGRGIQGCESVDLQGEPPHTFDGRLRQNGRGEQRPRGLGWKAGHAFPNETVQLRRQRERLARSELVPAAREGTRQLQREKRVATDRLHLPERDTGRDLAEASSEQALERGQTQRANLDGLELQVRRRPIEPVDGG